MTTISASADETYKSWKQGDSRWGSMRLGSSSYTMSNSGCAVTAVAMLMVHSGSVTDSSFNPGTFCTFLSNNGGLSSAGDISWSAATKLASSFQFEGYGSFSSSSASGKISEIKNYLDNGYYLAVSVKNGGHWVAIDRVENGVAYAIDPANGKVVNLFEAYSNSGISKIRKFRGANSVTNTTIVDTEEVAEELPTLSNETTTSNKSTTSTTSTSTSTSKNTTTSTSSSTKSNTSTAGTSTSTASTGTTTTTNTSTTTSKNSTYSTGLYQLTSDLCLRTDATSSADVIDIIPNATYLNVSDVDGEWGYVCYNGNMGWMHLGYAKKTQSSYKYSTGTYTTAEPLNYRASASISAESYGIIPINTTVEVLAVNGEWGKVSYNGKSAWICLSFVSSGTTEFSSAVNVAVSNSSNKVGTYVTTDNLCLRESNSTDTEKLDVIGMGTKIDIVSIDGNWGKTVYNGQIGWVCLDYAKLSNSTTPYDVNGDGQLNVNDILYVSDKLKNGKSFTQSELTTLDFDGNGSVDCSDYILLKQLILF
jgi:mannosyl-glycoprotein endo-beta-N-acetylglucosaminidase